MPITQTVRSVRTSLPLGLAAGCAAALVFADATPARAVEATPDLVTLHRSQGPAGLAKLLAEYDQLPVGRDRDELSHVIDQVAQQRYATVSRLYWYTDFTQATAAARATQRPILALRMLGKLDEELSCANSRLFRSVLYANIEVSQLMRDHFVLYWSSERPVPKVTIDMGDGRVIQRTTTGNSAHYVLDANGNVLDVLPGLYAPKLFKEELVKSLQLANTTRNEFIYNADPKKRTQTVTDFHRTALTERSAAYAKFAGGRYSGGGHRSFVPKLAAAQRATMSKRVMEMPDLTQFGMDPGQIARDDIEQWAMIGTRLWSIGSDQIQPAGNTTRPQAYNTFDTRSLHLISWLHDVGMPATSETARNAMVNRLEFSVIADSALNELVLRQQIRAKLVAEPGLPLEQLNAWIYAEVFHTPASDAWLGLAPRTDFTGLPGDGLGYRLPQR
ncbi:MAG: hypothetical protein H0V17_11135 [Deltaproteobacteria bacterium]|nr:hypothetical protein [Deltaproteobacteria bacterium]